MELKPSKVQVERFIVAKKGLKCMVFITLGDEIFGFKVDQKTVDLMITNNTVNQITEPL